MPVQGRLAPGGSGQRPALPACLPVFDAAMNPIADLHALLRQRPALQVALAPHLARAEGAEGEAAWAAALLGLARANAGPACLMAAAALDARLGGCGLHLAVALIDDAAALCCRAGASAALASLEALPVAQRCLAAGAHDPGGLAGWSRALRALGVAAPDCVAPVLGHVAALLRPAGLAGFEAFVATGLRTAGRDVAARRRFFSVEDAAARHALDRIAATVCFADAHRWMRPYVAALWGRAVPLAGAPGTRRVRLSDGAVRMPDAFPGVPAQVATSLFQAAAAHAAAHLLFGAARFTVGTLKPLQVVLVTLVEDARVEALAMRRFPGLRGLWAPWHVARTGGIPTVPALLARLARALFDPGWLDPAWLDEDALVRKARRLVAEADPEDPFGSRRIGDLLGNDLGQQRLQFDARAHVVEPAYRDDGVGLWRFDDAAGPDAETLEMLADALPAGDAADLPPDPSRPPCVEAVRGRPQRPARDPGPVVARHPEWDRAAGIERADWVTIRDHAMAAGPPGRVQAMLDAAPLARRRVARLLRGVAMGGRERLRRQQDGDDLDLAAAVEAAIDLRRGVLPDRRIHQGVAPRHRDLAVCLLLDASESTREAATEGGTVLDGQVHAVALLAEALAGNGTPCAVQAFASCGRDDVRLSRIQDFGAPWDAAARERLAGVAPGLSTRLGAALRHAGAGLRTRRQHRRLMLVLTDGVPSDIDTDAADLLEDARRGAASLRRDGLDVFGLVLGPDGTKAGEGVFGQGHWVAVPRIERLPQRLAEVYARLARR